MADELSDLQREWRTSVTESIKATDIKMDLILSQLSAIRLDSVRMTQLEKLDIRVSALESDRAKFIGAVVVCNIFFTTIGAIVLLFIQKLWK